ncbi:ABC transporter substrate-binding protein [Telluria mixta]|uniref:ABC transporter substrate-binding protein n=1 Tax=Telluria mixta TaxID=34071 RepID=A0ABT2BX69_9BURK|nr:CmpA/NrtA family ABC transporter substrate-binding protein [Telluria mixta]MCS0629739.1 ABC transporter substrate-binding protein [Telluria mixta]WEM96694.1 CmpA/NrtA family ABC transporter substrate-binding protein [Telluria mixta]
MAHAFIAGSDRPEKTVIRAGFMPLTDCASLVMASVLGLDDKYGIKLELARQHSWSGMRDRLLQGEIDAAHVLYGLLYGVENGIGTAPTRMAVLMNLSRNGQAITLSRALASQGVTDLGTLAAAMRRGTRRFTFAHTFPTGNHAMLLYYWLAAGGIDPVRDAQVVTVPPSQMAVNLAAGHMDGFCAGEPWSARAQLDGSGFTVATSQDIWPDHPGKALGATAAFVDANPHACRSLIAAVLEAGRWLDASEENRDAAAEVLASPAYVNADRRAIAARLHGEYDNGLGRRWIDPDPVRFHDDGEANFPYLSDAMWFMTQHRRWGLLRDNVDYAVVAGRVNRVGLYREAAVLAGVPASSTLMRRSVLMDGKVWDGSDPDTYISSFPIRREYCATSS